MSTNVERIDVDLMPKMGSIVIIDDELDEVKYLMRFLSKRGLGFEYYDGKHDNFPEQKRNVQLIFLDLNINGGNSVKMMISSMLSNVNAIIDDNNGPYCIAFWSENYQSNKDEINAALNSLPIKPEFCFDMEKAIIHNEDEQEIEKSLIIKLSENYGQNSLLKFMTLWMNYVNDTFNIFFNKLNKNILANIPSEKKLSAIAKYLLMAEYEKIYSSIENDKKLTLFVPLINKLVLSEFNRILLEYDVANRLIFDDNVNTDSINVVAMNTDRCISSKISIRAPKNVYECSSEDIEIKDLMGDKFKTNNILAKKLVNIDITHLCSYVQGKEKYHTFVTGLLLGGSYENSGIKDTTIQLGKILYDRKEWSLVICCNKISSIKEEEIDIDKGIFSITDLVYDAIRAKIVNIYSKKAI